MRGGTSRAPVFHRRDLPLSRADWDPIFLAAIGSPDPNGRQLDGLGGGISSLSKIVVVGPPSRADADVDYTFGQVLVGEPVVDYSGNCGNMSSAVGPFAVDEGLVAPSGSRATVRIHNTNTNKMIVAEFPLRAGRADVEGDYELLGVAGRGARIRLEFLEPGGAVTGRLLPTGLARQALPVAGLGSIEVSLVDATNPCVFLAAAALGLAGTELPEAIERDRALLNKIEAIRAAAAVAMGIAKTPEAASRSSQANPKIVLVAPPADATTLSGTFVSAGAMDLTVRMLSMGRPHRAVALTAAMCTAVAARVEGTVVHGVARPPSASGADVRLGHPSGTIDLAARVQGGADPIAESVVVYRTARRLMEGSILIPGSRVRNA